MKEADNRHVTDLKTFWIKRHPCSRGLSEQAIEEIAEEAELISVETGQVVQKSGQTVSSILFLVKGRLLQTIYDLSGRRVDESIIPSGELVGTLAAAQSDPVPVEVVAHEPSMFLRLDFKKALALAARHSEFQLNLFRLAGRRVGQTLLIYRVQQPTPTLAIVHQSPETRSLTVRLLERLVEIETTMCVLSDAPDWKEIKGVTHIPLREGERDLSPEAMRARIQQWSQTGRIVFDLCATAELERLCPLFGVVDQVYWCFRSSDWRPVADKLKEIERRTPGVREKVNAVWHLTGCEQFSPPAPELLQSVGRDFKISSSEAPPIYGSQLAGGFERIIHQMRGLKIGLALGGGAARGMAHLGVLKALEQNGVVVDMIAGTSAGAMTGTVYSSGLDVDYSIAAFVRDLTPSWFFRRIPRGGHWYLLHKYRRGHFDPMLRKYLDDKRLEQLPIPMTTVTVDLVSGAPVIRDQGDAVSAILESINLPVLSPPICRSGQALVDGGLVNNVPANVLVRKGCNFVIAVSVTAKLEAEFAHIRPDLHLEKYRSPSTLQTLLRGYLVSGRLFLTWFPMLVSSPTKAR